MSTRTDVLSLTKPHKIHYFVFFPAVIFFAFSIACSHFYNAADSIIIESRPKFVREDTELFDIKGERFTDVWTWLALAHNDQEIKILWSTMTFLAPLQIDEDKTYEFHIIKNNAANEEFYELKKIIEDGKTIYAKPSFSKTEKIKYSDDLGKYVYFHEMLDSFKERMSKVKVGWTAKQLLESLGYPQEIVKEKWIYRKSRFGMETEFHFYEFTIRNGYVVHGEYYAGGCIFIELKED